jgi:inosine-uridine nucleoside N-ribohydrolase
MTKHTTVWAFLPVAFVVLAGACTDSEMLPSTSSNPSTSQTEAVAEQAATAKRPVIVDYSPTVSDVGALLYLLSHPDVEVLGITLPVTGEAGCELGFEVTLGILAMLERDGVPVACDPEPPTGAEEWPAEFLAEQGNLSFGLPDRNGTAADARPAHQLIADVVAASDRPVTLLAVAPLTNVARALANDPQVADQLDRIVIMGGAVDAPGNVFGSDAEWNFWIDASAAASVMASGVPITLVPLDATDHVPVPQAWLRSIEAAPQNETITYLATLVRLSPAVTSGFFYLWDELAASVASGEEMVTTEEMRLIVSQEAGPSFGSSVRDPDGAPILVATAVADRNAFYHHFLSTLTEAPLDTQTPVVVSEATAPTSVGPGSVPEEVLAYWLIQGMKGQVETAASVVAPNAAWIEFGATPDTYVEGTQPFGSFDLEVACTSDQTLAFCDVAWNDLWIAAVPELDLGRLEAQAEVIDGMIVSFQALEFDSDTTTAFLNQIAWLETERPERFDTACALDQAAKECSQLIIATVADWVADR